MKATFGVLPITFTLIATQLGGGMILGTAQEAYTTGLWGICYALSIILGFLFLAFGIAGRIQSLQVSTTAELFETVYDAPYLKKFASLLSILTLSGLCISQMVGARSLLCSVGITNNVFFILFWSIIILATVFGGLESIVRANFIQISYIFLLFSALFLFCLSKETFSVFCLSCITTLQESLRSPYTTYSMLLTTLYMPAFYCLIEQDVAQRFFVARNKKVAITAAVYASILFLFFACIPLYFGIKARLLHIPLQPQANPLLPAITFLTNTIFAALAACGILIAITATANSLLCAICANIRHDFHVNKGLASKTVPFLFGICCLIASFYAPISVITIIIDSYAVSVVCLLVPLLFAYYNNSLPKQAALSAIIAGGSTYLACIILQIPYPKEGIALIASFTSFLLARFYYKNNFVQ